MARADIRINIDTKQAEKGLSNLDKSVGQFSERTGSARTRIRQIRDEMLELEPGSKQFQALAMEAGKLQDEMNKAQAQINSFASDTMALDGTVGTVQGLTSGFTSLTAVTALLGDENEELVQSFARIELIQRSVNGAIQTYQSFQRGSAAFTLIQTVRNRALAASITLKTRALQGATTAQRAMNIAMSAMPLIAILSGVTALITNWDKLSSVLSSTSREQEALNATMDAYQSAAEDAIAQTTSVQIAFDRAREGTMDKDEALRIYNETLGDTIGEAETLEEAERLFSDNTDRYIQASILRAQAQELIKKAAEEGTRALLAQEEDQRGFFERLGISILGVQSKIVDYSTAGLTNFSETAEQIDKISDQSARYRVQREATAQQDMLTELAKGLLEQVDELESHYKVKEELAEDEVESNADRLRRMREAERLRREEERRLERERIERQRANNAFFDAIEKQRIDNIIDEEERRIEEAMRQYDRLIELAERAGQDTEEITRQHNERIIAINQEFEDKRNEERQERINNERRLRAEVAILEEDFNLRSQLALAESEEEKEQIRRDSNERMKGLLMLQEQENRDILLENTELTELEREKIIFESEARIAEIRDQFREEEVIKNDNFIADLLEKYEEEINLFNEFLGGITGEFNEMLAIRSEEASAAREQRYSEEADALQHRLEQGVISQEESDAQLANLERAKRAEELKAMRQDFQRRKRMDTANAFMGMASAIIQAIAQFGPPPSPMGIAGIASAGVIGAAQIANIQSQQFRANRGGVVPGMTSHRDTVPALLAGGETVINSSSSRMFAPELSAINEAGGGKRLNNEGVRHNVEEVSYGDNREQSFTVDVSITEIEDVNKRVNRYRDLNEF